MSNVLHDLELATARLRVARLDQKEIPQLLTDLDLLLKSLKPVAEGHGIHAPSHYTPKMAAAALNISHALVHYHCRANGRLAAEFHHGQKLIPAWRILAFIEARKAAR